MIIVKVIEITKTGSKEYNKVLSDDMNFTLKKLIDLNKLAELAEDAYVDESMNWK